MAIIIITNGKLAIITFVEYNKTLGLWIKHRFNLKGNVKTIFAKELTFKFCLIKDRRKDDWSVLQLNEKSLLS